MDETGRIASLEEVPHETTLLFRVRPVSDSVSDTGDGGGGGEDTIDSAHNAYDTRETGALEAIVVGIDGDGESEGEVACWLNYCQHLTHIRLDKGSGAAMRNGELVCENHGAYFESGTGLCTFGPCEGAYLNAVDVTVDDGAVYLTDDRYEFVGRGGLERGDLDRTSTSNVEF